MSLHRSCLDASHLSAAPRSSMRTSPKPPTSPAGLASRSTSSRTKFQAPRMRPSLMRNESHQSWCTGKDSNLRTSQGGTDLQSVGFNHSPTCANFRAFPATNRNSRNQPRRLRCARRMMLRQGNDPKEEQSARENPLARKHHTWKNSLWSAVGKNLLRRRAAKNALYSGTEMLNQMLELAKGFEPPTL